MFLLFWVFVVSVVVQCGYALYFFSRVRQFGNSHMLPVAHRKPVSIVICAKNEADNLRDHLPFVLNQQYHNEQGQLLFEVVVVNDASADDTSRVLLELQQQFSHLHVVNVRPDEERMLKGKKHALAKGVAHSSYNWLLLTDADCKPASDKWLERMVAPLGTGKEIVAGYGGYEEKYGVLNAFIRWETLHTFLQYSSYAAAGIPYMAVGRNLGVRKEILQNVEQHPLWTKLAAGDDDMLVQIAGRKDNVAVVCSPEAFTISAPQNTWTGWMRQKQRHLSIGKYYKPLVKILLGGYASSQAVFWITFFVLVFVCPSEILILTGIRCLLYWTIWTMTARKLKEKKLYFWFPLFDIGWVVYHFIFFPFIAWRNKKSWK